MDLLQNTTNYYNFHGARLSRWESNTKLSGVKIPPDCWSIAISPRNKSDPGTISCLISILEAVFRQNPDFLLQFYYNFRKTIDLEQSECREPPGFHPEPSIGYPSRLWVCFRVGTTLLASRTTSISAHTGFTTNLLQFWNSSWLSQIRFFGRNRFYTFSHTIHGLFKKWVWAKSLEPFSRKKKCTERAHFHSDYYNFTTIWAGRPCQSCRSSKISIISHNIHHEPTPCQISWS